MPMHFSRNTTATQELEIWSASECGFSFVISKESSSGPGLHGKPGFVASWRPINLNRTAIRVGGSPFKTFAEAEKACEAMLVHLINSFGSGVSLAPPSRLELDVVGRGDGRAPTRLEQPVRRSDIDARRAKARHAARRSNIHHRTAERGSRRPEWQAAIEAVMLVSRGGPTMTARIGVMRALNRGHVREPAKSNIGERKSSRRRMSVWVYIDTKSRLATKIT
jgi:hypothetical protein